MSLVKSLNKKSNSTLKASNKVKKDKKALLTLLRDLDGDEEDLELIEGIDSDQDDELSIKKDVSEKKKQDTSLMADLAKFQKSLGLGPGKFQQEVLVDDDWEDQQLHESASEEAMEEQSNQLVEPTAATTTTTTKEERKAEHKAAKASAKEAKKAAKLIAQQPQEEKIEQTFDVKIDKAAHKKQEPILSPEPLWHTIPLPPLQPPKNEPLNRELTISKLLERSAKLMAAEAEYYAKSSHVKSSDRSFLGTIMRSGTLNDRVSALTLVVQESPIHASKSLDALMNMCKKKSRNEAVSAIGAVKDLLQSTLLPDRKLRYFKDQPLLLSPSIEDVHLILFGFEDALKRYYFELLGVMETLSLDPLPFPRNHMVRYFFDLLKDKPEQEANLLRLLVNKLGDKDKKIASRCSHFILQLEQAHPAMKAVIVKGLEEFLFRQGMGVGRGAQYYTVITLNQTILRSNEEEVLVANRLIETYFTFFAKLINSPGAGSLAASTPQAEDKLVKFENKEVKKNRKAVKKEKEKEEAEEAEEELVSKMISAVLTGVNRAFPFSKLPSEIFDKNLDTLYKITHASNFNTSIQALLLIFQIAGHNSKTADRFYRTLYESVNDPRLIASSKQALWLNLVFKALKADTNIPRVKAFVKRMVQVATGHNPAFCCALFFLLGELQLALPPLRELLQGQSEPISPVTAQVVNSEDNQVEDVVADKTKEYDGRSRDPRFANADKSKLYELLPFLKHYHPSVQLFSSSFFEGNQMPSKPDLSLHTLTHFLDRFVYRNAKTKANNKGGSIMQPQAGADTRGLILSTSNTNASVGAVNEESFWKQAASKVAVDEKFFHRYFNERMSSKPSLSKRASKKTDDVVSDEDGGDDGMDEDDVWRALVNSRPEVEALSDDDDDDDDLEELAAGMSSDSDLDFDQDEDSDEIDPDEDIEENLSDEEGHVPGPQFTESEFTNDDEFGFDEDEDDLLPSDGEDGGECEEEEFTGFEEASSTGKRKRSRSEDKDLGGEKKDKKKKKIKLPAFASADDYAALLDQE